MEFHFASIALSLTTIIASIVSLAIIYTITLVVQRLLLSPIAHFPGPKLAAATFWYEFYYDVYSRGQFEYHLADLHKKYGPIIRINPYELHIQDSEFYDTVYNNGSIAGKKTRVDKHEWHSKQFGSEMSSFGTPQHELHRTRRSAFAQTLSKRAVSDLEPLIQSKVDRLVARLKESYAGRKAPIDLHLAYSALTGDVISDYCFGQSLDLLERPDFGGWHKLMHEFGEVGHLAKQIRWLQPLLKSLPDGVSEFINPAMSEIAKLTRLTRTQIMNIQKRQKEAEIEGKEFEAQGSGHRTVFHEILGSSIPEHEKHIDRLEAEAFILVAAGTVTTADILGKTTFYILNNPECLHRLRTELRSVQEKVREAGDGKLLQRLEQLPYFTAIIKEGLRTTVGIMQRLPRIFPDSELAYHDWIIPRGTPVSQSTWQVLEDPAIFPEPMTFRPERWLDDGTEEVANLGRYLVSFTKGTRMCVGLNLAWAELYLTLAGMFGIQDFRMELFETTEADLKGVRDEFMPGYPLDSKGMRVVVE